MTRIRISSRPKRTPPAAGSPSIVVGQAVGRLDGRGDPLLEGALALALALVQDPGAPLAEVERAVGLVADEHHAGPVRHVGVVGDVDRDAVEALRAWIQPWKSGMKAGGSMAPGSSA